MKQLIAAGLILGIILSGCIQTPPVNNIDQKCSLAPDPGNCEAIFPKYYFDQTTLSCKEFIWGGCGGVVPFETLEECQNSCQAQTNQNPNQIPFPDTSNDGNSDAPELPF